jgi:hypothetical protein
MVIYLLDGDGDGKRTGPMTVSGDGVFLHGDIYG